MICLANDSDLPALVPLFRTLHSYHVTHVPEVFHDASGDAAFLAVLQKARDEAARILVYKTQDISRGYLLWKPLPPAPTPLHKTRRLALLDQIYVEPICRRRGMASRLVARFEAEVSDAGYDGWVARVHAFNAASAALMQRLGAAQSVVSYLKPV
jgi:GNAT superfamily N-acetyltransferase